MPPLLATAAASLGGAREVAGGLSDLGLYYVCGVEAAVIVALFALLVRSWYLRLRDFRDLLQEVLRHLQSNTEGAAELARAILTKMPRLKRAREDAGAVGGGSGPPADPPKPGAPGGHQAGL